jgi:hypothetical protein
MKPRSLSAAVAQLFLVRPMAPRAQLQIAILVVLCIATAVAADGPRLTPADVLRAADARAGQHADLRSYARGEPSYDPVSKTWGVNYRLKSFEPQSTGQRVLSVSVDDETGFASTRFWLVPATSATSATSAPSTSPRSYAHFLIIQLVFGVFAVGVLIWSAAGFLVRPAAPTMATVANCFDLNEAHRLKMVLGCAGIESFIPDESTATVVPYQFIGSSGGVRLQVANPEARKARLVLEKHKQSGERDVADEQA